MTVGEFDEDVDFWAVEVAEVVKRVRRGAPGSGMGVASVEDVLIGARAICYGDPDKPAFPSATTEIFEDAMVTSLTG